MSEQAAHDPFAFTSPDDTKKVAKTKSPPRTRGCKGKQKGMSFSLSPCKLKEATGGRGKPQHQAADAAGTGKAWTRPGRDKGPLSSITTAAKANCRGGTSTSIGSDDHLSKALGRVTIGTRAHEPHQTRREQQSRREGTLTLGKRACSPPPPLISGASKEREAGSSPRDRALRRCSSNSIGSSISGVTSVESEGSDSKSIRSHVLFSPSDTQEPHSKKAFRTSPNYSLEGVGLPSQLEGIANTNSIDGMSEMNESCSPRSINKMEDLGSERVADLPARCFLDEMQMHSLEMKELSTQEEESPITLAVASAASLQHNPHLERDLHQECPARYSVLAGPAGVLRGEEFHNLRWLEQEIFPATISDVLRVHEWDYIRHLQSECKRAALSERKGNISNGDAPAHPKMSKSYGERYAPPPGMLDGDTHISPASYQVAAAAAGAVIAAVDRVVNSPGIPNAFVVARPPGHHAGPRGSVAAGDFWKSPDSNSSGFCLLNNVAIGAAYARATYGRDKSIERIAIVDMDVHAGNGTEEIVRSLTPQVGRVPLPSSWSPQKFHTYKPWLDESDSEKVLFASVHLVADGFFPGSTQGPLKEGNDNVINVELSPVLTGGQKKHKLPLKKVTALCKEASLQFRERCRAQLLTKLKEFSPHLIFISSTNTQIYLFCHLSAGFDGHFEDMYHFNTDADYYWLTTELMECLDPQVKTALNTLNSPGTGKGGVVSCLEGGYSLTPVTKQAAKSKARGTTDPDMHQGGLARGAAAHVRALMGLPCPQS